MSEDTLIKDVIKHKASAYYKALNRNGKMWNFLQYNVEFEKASKYTGKDTTNK